MAKIKPVLIVRHGQTKANIEGRAQGWSDTELTRQGVLQTMALKKWLNYQPYHFKRIYSSDLGRALQTSAILSDGETEVYGVPGLREITFGDLDGQDRRKFEDVNWETDYEKHGGESYDAAITRAWQTLCGILTKEFQENPEDTTAVLIVTHSAILKGYYYLLDKDPDGKWPEEPLIFNCETFLCDLDLDTGRIILKDTYHPPIS